MAWCHRKILRRYLNDSRLQVQTILDLKALTLKQQGIEALILDFDGVLAAHGAEKPLKAVEVWLKECINHFGPGRLFILSNRPSVARASYFKRYFPEIEFLWLKRKKPFSDGLLDCLSHLSLSPNHVLLIDDRLLTGLLLAAIEGFRGSYVRHPWVCFSKKPMAELFYQCLRWVERLLF
jgi:HAD superfamily phosphatase (TIGR01668 family)